MTWEFRIIEGLQEGCNYSLEEGKTYKVGSSYDCDILVLDQENQTDEEVIYFEFTLGKDNVIFSKVNQLIQNQSGNIVYEGLEFSLPLVLSFLNTKAAICKHSDSNETLFHTWQKEKESDKKISEKEDLSSFDENDLLKDLKLYDDSTSEIGKQNFMSKLKKAWKIALSKAKERAQAFQNQKELKNAIPFLQKYKHFVILGGILAVLCVLSIVILGVVSSSSHPSRDSTDMTSVGAEIQGIKQIILNLPPSFANIKILPGKDGKFLVEGLVIKPADFVFLKSKLKAYDSVLSYKISTTDQAIAGIKQILKEKGISLDVTYDSVYAQISLSGVVSDLNVINDLELAISSQFPEIGSTDTNRIYSAADIETDFNKVISANNYTSRLHIEKNILNKQITIQGYLSKSDMQILQIDMDKLSKKYNNIVSIDVKVKDIVYALPFKISMVYTGDNPMFITDDGRKVFQGGSIAGMTVQKITQNEIIFDGEYPLVYSLNTAFAPDENTDKSKSKTDANETNTTKASDASSNSESTTTTDPEL